LSSGKGEGVKVAYAQNQTEAAMIQGLLSECGIPSVLKGGPIGLDSIYNVTAGPRYVFVPEELAERAREVLEGTPGAG
jgi:hypothetical protein